MAGAGCQVSGHRDFCASAFYSGKIELWDMVMCRIARMRHGERTPAHKALQPLAPQAVRYGFGFMVMMMMMMMVMMVTVMMEAREEKGLPRCTNLGYSAPYGPSEDNLSRCAGLRSQP
eukprot:4033300-Amphidinium_carterae.1